jgi:hypothetical protein
MKNSPKNKKGAPAIAVNKEGMEQQPWHQALIEFYLVYDRRRGATKRWELKNLPKRIQMHDCATLWQGWSNSS